jgi:hypothetical protein
VVDEQLGTPVEELGERLLAVVRVESVLRLHPHPRQLASLVRDLVPEPGVLLLADEQPLACGEPLFTRSDPLIGHSFFSFLSSQQLAWHAPPHSSLIQVRDQDLAVANLDGRRDARRRVPRRSEPWVDARHWGRVEVTGGPRRSGRRS